MTTTANATTFNELVARTMNLLSEGKAEPTITVDIDTGDRTDSLVVTASNATYKGKPAVKHAFKLSGERISYRAAELLMRAYPVYRQR